MSREQFPSDWAEHIVGLAQYVVVDDRRPRAQLACSVVDAYQGGASATLLMERVLGIARVRGITEFEADVLIAGGAGGASLSILCKALRAEQFPPPGM